MERKVGSKFKFGDTVLKVIEMKEADCNGCFMFEHELPCGKSFIYGLTGDCIGASRSDKKDVIFVEVK